MIRNSIYLILLAVFLSSVASIACKSKISTSDTSDIKTAAEILNSTGIAMQSISSFKFKLTHENLQGTRIGDLILSEANGTISVSYYTSPSPRDGLLSRMPSSA